MVRLVLATDRNSTQPTIRNRKRRLPPEPPKLATVPYKSQRSCCLVRSSNPIFRLGLYFNPLISWQEVPRNSGNCAQLLATIEQSADRRPRQLTVGAGLIESEKARYFRAIFCTQ